MDPLSPLCGEQWVEKTLNLAHKVRAEYIPGGEGSKLRQSTPAEIYFLLLGIFCRGFFLCIFSLPFLLALSFKLQLMKICHRSGRLKPRFAEDEWNFKINLVVPSVSGVPITTGWHCPVPLLLSLGGESSIHYKEAEPGCLLMELSCLTLMCA